MVGKTTKFLKHTIAKGRNLRAVFSTKPTAATRANANSFDALAPEIDADANKDAFAELPMAGLNWANLKGFFGTKGTGKRTEEMKDIRRYLHAIRVYYGFDTTVAMARAYKSYYRFSVNVPGLKALPSLWSEDYCWYMKGSKLVKMHMPRSREGKIGMFGF